MVSIAIGTGLAYSGSRAAGTYAFGGATTVAAGDILVALVRNGDASQTITSLTSTGTATVSTWTRVVDIGTTNTTTRHALFTATVSAGGTVTPSITVAASTQASQINLFVLTNAASVSAVSSTSARQISKAIAAGSIVISSAADWTAQASTGATFTPAGATIVTRMTDGVDQQATNGANYSEYVAYWTNQSAATTVYGLSTPSTGTYNSIVVEAVDAAPAVAVVTPPRRFNLPGLFRRGPFKGIAATVSRVDAFVTQTAALAFDSSSTMDIAGMQEESPALGFDGSNTLSITPADTTPPTNPSGLAATNITDTTFDLSWNPSTDNVAVTSYSININGSTAFVTGTPATTFTVTGRTAGTTYVVKVIARDAPGNFSGFSNIINVTTTGGVSLGFNGSNTLVADGVVAESASLGFAGSNAVSVTGFESGTTGISLSGSNALSVIGTLTHSVALSFAGSSSVSVSGLLSASAALAFAGTGTLGVTAGVSRSLALSFAGAGTLSVNALSGYVASLAFAGANTFGVSVTGASSASIAFAGSNSLAVVTSITRNIALAFAGVGSLGITAQSGYVSALTFAGSSTVNVSGLESRSISGLSFAGSNGLAISVSGSQNAAIVFAGSSGLALTGSKALTLTIVFAGSSGLGLGAGAGIQRVAVLGFGGANDLSILSVLGRIGGLFFSGSNTLDVVLPFAALDVDLVARVVERLAARVADSRLGLRVDDRIPNTRVVSSEILGSVVEQKIEARLT